MKQQLRKQMFFGKEFEEKVSKIWNEIDPDVIRNLYETYANRLLEVKKTKGVMTRYCRLIELNIFYYLMFVMFFFKFQQMYIAFWYQCSFGVNNNAGLMLKLPILLICVKTNQL